jgi:hypothetical protein
MSKMERMIELIEKVEGYGKSKDIASKPTNPKDAIGILKAPMSTVPAEVMLEVGVALLEGAIKYGRHNYRVVGVRSSVYYDATMRHLMAWWEGEDADPDSGLSHITKAIASLTVLRDAMIRGKVNDDRPPKTLGFVAELNGHAERLLKASHEHKQAYTAAAIQADVLAEAACRGEI